MHSIANFFQTFVSYLIISALVGVILLAFFKLPSFLAGYVLTNWVRVYVLAAFLISGIAALITVLWG